LGSIITAHNGVDGEPSRAIHLEITDTQRSGAVEEALMTRLTAAFLACACVVIAGCGTAQYEWNKALAANTLAGYQAFLKDHGGSKYAADARGRVLGLEDDQAWSLAKATNTIDGYREYLRAEPGGVHAADARYEIGALERAQAWKSLPNDASADSLRAFLQKYPQGQESNEARQKLAALDYRVQLAVAGTRSAAERRRAQIQARFGDVVHGLVVVAPLSPHAIYRVTSAPMSQADANSACAVLARSHQSCKPVPNEITSG
jgi:hypothetical protein